MDHVIEGMQPHYEVLLDWFIKEHRKGQYKKLSDNPYANSAETLNRG